MYKTNNMNVEHANIVLSFALKTTSFRLIEMLWCNDLIRFIVDANYLRFITYNSDLLVVRAILLVRYEL